MIGELLGKLFERRFDEDGGSRLLVRSVPVVYALMALCFIITAVALCRLV